MVCKLRGVFIICVLTGKTSPPATEFKNVTLQCRDFFSKTADTYHIFTSALSHQRPPIGARPDMTGQKRATARLNFIQRIMKLHGLRHSCPDGRVGWVGSGSDLRLNASRVPMQFSPNLKKKKKQACRVHSKYEMRQRSAGLRWPSAA